MSYYDPCPECREPKRDCVCKHNPPDFPDSPPPDPNGRYQIIEEIFLGGHSVVATDLSLDEARAQAHDMDVYTSQYILPMEIDSSAGHYRTHIVSKKK